MRVDTRCIASDPMIPEQIARYVDGTSYVRTVVHISWGSSGIKHSKQVPSVCYRVDKGCWLGYRGWNRRRRGCVTATSVGEDLKVYPRVGIPHLLFGRFDTSRAFLSSRVKPSGCDVENIPNRKEARKMRRTCDLTVTRDVPSRFPPGLLIKETIKLWFREIERQGDWWYSRNFVRIVAFERFLLTREWWNLA